MGEPTAEFSVSDYNGLFESKSPEENHNSWMKNRLENGWVYGEVKDIEKKIHPCLVPYEQLPKHQKVKDYIAQELVSLYNRIIIKT